MDFVTNFFQSSPIIATIVSLIVITAVISIVRGLVKLALGLAVVAIIAAVFFNVSPDRMIKTGQEITKEATTYYQNTLKPVVDKEMVNAKYTEKPDGSYVVKTTSLSLTGKKGEEAVVIAYKDKSTKVDMSLLGDKFKAFVESHGKTN